MGIIWNFETKAIKTIELIEFGNIVIKTKKFEMKNMKR